MNHARSELIQDLKDRLARIEQSVRRPAYSGISTGAGQLDQLLSRNGLQPGTLLEWVNADEGSGAATLALVVAGRVQEHGGAVVAIDPHREFFPPAAHALGLSLPGTLIVQPKHSRDALWAWEQSLRSSSVAVVVGSMDKIGDRVFRRLQLAAEAGGSMGFLLRPASCRSEPTWASARLLVKALASDNLMAAPGRRLRIETLYCRGGFPRNAIEVELRDEANTLRLVSSVADSATSRRAAGA